MATASGKVESSFLKVEGARVYYEVRGSGPLLLTIPGGPADAGVYVAMGNLLAERFTVVSYDPRGNSRSVLDDPKQEQNMDVHGDDAAQLIAFLGGGAAHVLGNSGGAKIALNLTARHPQSVAVLVAHEPPCMELLPDPGERREFEEQISRAYASEGAGAAFREFLARTGIADGPKPAPVTAPTAEMEQTAIRIKGNLDFFFGRMFDAIGRYAPDVAALRTGPARVAVGVGEASRGQMPFRTAVVLAERLGVVPEFFPGGHSGFSEQPEVFALRLEQVMREARRPAEA